MIIRNKYLNISSRDIEKETDLLKLKQWLIDIDENIICMDMAITQAKLKAYEEGVYADKDWFNKITTAVRLQKILKSQLEHHIGTLEKSEDKKIIEFLKNKFNISNDEWNKLLKQMNENGQE